MITLHTALQTLKSLLFNLQPHCPFQQRRLAACPNSAVMLMEDMSPKSSSRAPEPVKPERTPRQEEKWQKRESTLLDHVQFIIDDVGYAHFNMDRLVREDCLAALCCRGMEELKDMFLRAQAFDGKPREKALAIHYAYRLHMKLHPVMSTALVTARTAAFVEKTSPQRAAKVRHNDETFFAIAFEVIDAAVRAGDLEITEDLDATVITFLTWSTSYGINMLEDTGFEHTISDLLEEKNIALIGANVLMDGIGMKPLSKDWDYRATWQRIAEEVFPEESQRASL